MAAVSFLGSKLPQKALIKRTFHLVNGEKQTVGRLATRLSILLQGKHKPTYNQSQDDGDMVVVMNCEKVHLSGRKMQNKLYRHHSGYPGGLKEIPAWRMIEKKPHDVLRRAVRGMLPKNHLRDIRMARLRLYVGDANHKHGGQLPQLPAPEDTGDQSTTETNEESYFLDQYIEKKGYTPEYFKDYPDIYKAAQDAMKKIEARKTAWAKMDVQDAANRKKQHDAEMAARAAALKKRAEEAAADAARKSKGGNDQQKAKSGSGARSSSAGGGKKSKEKLSID